MLESLSKTKRITKMDHFAAEFVKNGFNGTLAAKKCGYSPKTAHASAARLLQDPRVRAEINKSIIKRTKRTEIDADFVLLELAAFLQADIREMFDKDGCIKNIKDMPRNVANLISSVDLMQVNKKLKVHRVRLMDKVKILESIGKHVDVQAFAEKQDVKITGKVTVEQLHNLANQDTSITIDATEKQSRVDDVERNRTTDLLSKADDRKMAQETPDIF